MAKQLAVSESSDEGDRLRRLQMLEDLRVRMLRANPDPVAEAAMTVVSDLVGKYPLLHAVMTAHLLRGGPDEGATLILWGADGGLGGMINVKQWSRKAFFQARTLQDFLQGVENHLQDPDAKWASDKQQKRPKGQRGTGKQGKHSRP